MGFKRVCCSGCCGMLCLLPMAYISFRFLDLTSQITGGLIQNISSLADVLPMGDALIFVVGAIVGVLIVCLFPIHWALINNPGDVMLLLSIIVPWILCCAITAGLFAHSPRGGFDTSLAIGIGWFFVMLLPYIAVSIMLGSGGLLDGLATGFTGMPWILAVLTATMEGAAVGGVFGAFVGSLKYDADEVHGKKKKKGKSKKKDKDDEDIAEPTFGGSSKSKKDSKKKSSKKKDSAKKDSGSAAKNCKNCGAKISAGDEFCTNCGSKN